jgi:ABC-type amino acid transport substrate-binding protein
MKPSIIFTALLAAFLSIYLPYSANAQSTESSVLDRIKSSGIIRCSYAAWEPYVVKDPNTGKISGIAVDYLEQTAATKGLKIKWTEEIGFDQIVPHLNSGRSDMFCLPCSPFKDFKKVLDFAGSFGKLPYYVYVPAKSKLTEEQLKTAKFSAIDGYIPMVETPITFPNAKVVSLPQNTSMAELYDQLKYGKTDALINEHISALNYMRNNPGIIRRFSDTPVIIKDMSFPVKKDDLTWFNFINDMTDTSKNEENRNRFETLIKTFQLYDNALLAR